MPRVRDRYPAFSQIASAKYHQIGDSDDEE
jgi:hypothetical protein